MRSMYDTWKGLVKDLFTLGALIVLVVIPIRVFIVSPYIVDGASMYPTFDSLDYLIVNQLIYNFSTPERGDVIVFRYPKDPSVFYVKRVIGLPGEKISIRRGVVSIFGTDGKELSLTESYIVHEDATYTKDVTLTNDEYFVIGDNRPNSSDSRTWGPLREKNIIGRVDLRIFPIQKAGIFPGATSYAQAEQSTL
jgi:signal peptidase I